jgi:hypothetical protein
MRLRRSEHITTMLCWSSLATGVRANRLQTSDSDISLSAWLSENENIGGLSYKSLQLEGRQLKSRSMIRFIRIIDRIFDTLNSKNPFAKEFKSVLSQDHIELTFNVVRSRADGITTRQQTSFVQHTGSY